MTTQKTCKVNGQEVPQCVCDKEWDKDPDKEFIFVPVPVTMSDAGKEALEKQLCAVIETAIGRPNDGAHGECKKSDGSEWPPAVNPPCFWLRVIPK